MLDVVQFPNAPISSLLYATFLSKSRHKVKFHIGISLIFADRV